VLELAMSEARELNHSYVGTEHLLLGLLREEKGIAAQVLTDGRGEPRAGAGGNVAPVWGARCRRPPRPAAPGPSPPRPRARRNPRRPALDHFCRDLTQLAAEGQLDPTIGRQKEIER